jgi:type VI secretion system protein ImpK
MKAAQPQSAEPNVAFEPTAPSLAAASGDVIAVAARQIPPRNTMLAAAEPLLSLVAGIRAGRAQLDLPRLHGLVSAEIQRFGEAVRGAYPEEHVKRAAYALGVTADDVAMNMPGQSEAVAEWARRSISVKFFGEAIGGDRFWTLLDQMIARPRDYPDVLELFHCCLASGFLGRYRVLPNGRAEHQAKMQSAYQALDHVRNLSSTELSPHWRGVRTEMGSLRFWTPLLLAGAGASCLLLLVYIAFRLALWHFGAPAYAALEDLAPKGPLHIVRATEAAPPPLPASTQLQRIEAFLKPEIDQRLVVVKQTATNILVRTTVPSLFESGSKELSKEEYQRLIERIAAALDPEKGAIRVAGHTDSQNISTSAFPDNMALSEARAKTVADIIRAHVQNSSRVSAEWFGETDPIASNDTPEGKGQNRRVEISIPRDQA